MIEQGSLAQSGLTDDQQHLLAKHIATLTVRATRNGLREAYYRGRERVKQLGIAVPPHMQQIEEVVGWPAMVVDVLEERLDIEGFTVPDLNVDDLGLREMWSANGLDLESSQAHLDALIYGVEFVAITNGDAAAGEPHPLITVEPATRMTGEWDARLRRMTSAASIVWDEKNQRESAATLYLPNENIFLVREDSGRWVITGRDEHHLGRLTVVRLVNRPRSGRRWGSSEITRPIMSITDNAVRTLLGMEVSREFYSSPQRWMMGADEQSFVGPDGKPLTAWEAYLGRFLALTRDEDGNVPQVGQFAASSPEPYISQIKMLAQLLAAEGAMPAAYLGFHTDNPSSADAIRVGEARLVKRAERRQAQFGAAWAEVIRVALLRRERENDPEFMLPAELSRLTVLWRDAATPTRASAAAAATQLISVGALPPTSEVTYEYLGFSEVDKQRLLADARRERAQQFAAGMASQRISGGGADEVTRIKAQADALGALIRAGVDPADAAARVGLPGVKLRPEQAAAQLEER